MRAPVRLQNPASVFRVEEVNGGDVSIRDQVDLEVFHESSRRHPEVVPHEAERLHVLAIALPECGHKRLGLFTLSGEEPLLELVEDHQYLAPGLEAMSVPEEREQPD